MSSLVTIMTNDIADRLSIARTYLEDNGIESVLKDELMNHVHPFGLGGVKLQVLEEDAVRAIELLIEGGFATKEDYEVPESTLRLERINEKIANFFKKKQ